MGSDSDINDVIRWAESQKWTVEIDTKGYRRFIDPQGNFVVSYPATPSNPRRRLMDVLVAVKKAGLPWPAPSKKEQRSQRRKGESQ